VIGEAGTPFVIFTTQRSGSTWLASVLNGFDGVIAHDELLLRRKRSTEPRWDSEFAYPRYVESEGRYGRLRPFSVFSYLNALYASRRWVGFKLMYSDVKAYPEVLPYLLAKQVRVVHLVRRNHLDVLISFAVKRDIGKAHILAMEDRPQDLSVELDTASLLRDLERMQRKHDVARRLLELGRLRHLEVAYEDLVSDPSAFDAPLTFLDIPWAREIPESNIVRTRQGTQSEVVSNYDDVRRTLAGSKFAGLLD
jgi:LPS sulfotransferase NodH